MAMVYGRDGKPVETQRDSELDEPRSEGGSAPQDDPLGDYQVGYKKPPVHSRFGKGNKHGKGRPKGAKNLKTMVNDAFGAKVPAKLDGKIRKMTKGELAIHQLANKASAGDLKAIDKAIAMQERYGPREDPEGPSAEDLQIDLETLREYLAYHDMISREDGEEEHG